MHLYDLETFVERKRTQGEGGDVDDAILRRDVKFTIVLDERVIPPLEIMDGLATRELVLLDNQVIVQKRVARAPLSSIVSLALSGDGDLENGGSPGQEAGMDPTVEYEPSGVLPEGAFMFDEHFFMLHVGKHGRVTQVDVLRRDEPPDDGQKPVNKEFNNMLVSGVKEHGWDALVAHFSSPRD